MMRLPRKSGQMPSVCAGKKKNVNNGSNGSDRNRRSDRDGQHLNSI
jgi:hypothetical protein